MTSIFSKTLFSGIVAVALPTLVLLSGLYELFPVPGWVDPMIYVGYFLDPAEQIWRYGPLYYSGRVPYIFVGHLFYSAFNPVAAHIAMVLFFNGLALFAIFMAAFRVYGRNVAILSSWWLGLNPIWVNSVSTGYVDGPAMAFGFVAFMCSVLAVTRSRSILTNLLLVASGFFVAITTIIHPIPGGLAALAVLVTCLILTKVRWSAIRDLIYVGLGGILGLAISTVYACQLGAPTIFSFFVQGPVARVSVGDKSLYAVPFSEWFSGSYWVITPLVLLLLAYIVTRKSDKSAASLILVGFACLVSVLAFLLLWDTTYGGVTLQKHFYVSYLVYGEAILVVSILGKLQQSLFVEELNKMSLYSVIAVVATVLLAFQYLPVASGHSLDQSILWFVLVALGGITVFLFQTQMSTVAITCLMWFTILSGIANAGTRMAFADSSSASYKLIFEDVTEIRRVAELTYLRGRNVFFWGNRHLGLLGRAEFENDRFSYTMTYAGKQERFNELDSLAALWVWDKGSLGFEMPTIENADVARLQRSKGVGSVVMACLRTVDCDQGVAALNKLGLVTSIRTRTTIWVPGLEPSKVVVVDF